jgi:thrombospondin-type laminin G domain and EAR repeat-containing protein
MKKSQIIGIIVIILIIFSCDFFDPQPPDPNPTSMPDNTSTPKLTASPTPRVTAATTPEPTGIPIPFPIDISLVICQEIETSYGRDLEYFSIGDDHFLAAAHYYNGSEVQLESPLYKWDGSAFVSFQEFSTQGASDWHYFSIDNRSFLAAAHSYDTSYDTLSLIYEWDPQGAFFDPFQIIETNGAMGWEYFSIDNQHFLVVANYFDTYYFADSQIYKWAGGLFEPYQSYQTGGARDWEFFTIEDFSFLAVASSRNGPRPYDISHYSSISMWNPVSEYFEPFQTISTSCAVDMEYFSINGESFLVAANCTDGFNTIIDSPMYKWDPGSMSFELFQTIETSGAQDWEYFSILNNHYLVVANADDGTTSLTNSVLYKWDEDSRTFAPELIIPTRGAFDWEYFFMDGNHYLALANAYDGVSYTINSIIYRIQY